jgi:hypothetical protein
MTLAEIQRLMNKASNPKEVLETCDTIHDETLDIAIRITNELVAEGIVKDCTDTNDPSEFVCQDIIHQHLIQLLTRGAK